MKFITLPEQRRQVARAPLTFPPELTPYVNWQALAETQRALGCDVHISAVADPGGVNGLRVEFSWPVTADDEESL